MTTRSKVIFAIACLALAAAVAAGVFWVRGADARRIMAEVAMRMKDPDSAKFDGVFYNATERVGCGFVNGKNSYGAYVGLRQFYFVEDTGHVEFAPLDDSDGGSQSRRKQAEALIEFHQAYMRLCLNVESS